MQVGLQEACMAVAHLYSAIRLSLVFAPATHSLPSSSLPAMQSFSTCRYHVMLVGQHSRVKRLVKQWVCEAPANGACLVKRC